MRADVIAVCDAASRALGFDPLCQIHGPLDTLVTGTLAEHLTLTLREALSNVARHAGATAVQVIVGVDGGRVRLEVVDNGRGLPAEANRAGNGIVNMRSRADAVGGALELTTRHEGGTRLVWTASLAE